MPVTELPDTRDSLIVRLQDAGDREAWAEFARLYRPVVYRIARRRGLQDADAQDLAQRVLMSVARAAERWQPDGKARFRTWLRTIANNAVIDQFRRAVPDAAAGGTTALGHLEQVSQGDPTLDEVEREHRRAAFRAAAQLVEPEFAPETWRAFWETAVEGRPVADVATELSKSAGAIYVARSRVMRRLREEVCRLEGESS